MSRHTTYRGISHVGQGFTPGIHWRADRPGSVAVPAGPDGPINRPDPEPDGRLGGSVRHAHTAERMAAVADALMPKRWRPPE